MRKISAAFLFPLIALGILCFAMSQPMFNLPPFGKLLDPFNGVVRNGDDLSLNQKFKLIRLGGTRDSVNVFFDDRKVPHIFAKNETDLYFAQGYVTASLRLWQMDFLSYNAAGRLAEIFGNDLLDYDRNQRRIGIPDAAKASLEFMEKDSLTRNALNAYTAGVNAYIQKLSYKTIPVEYKILDYTPEPWSNLKSALIMKQMAATLSGYEEDFSMSNLIVALGEDKFNRLFPDFPSPSTPVMNRYSDTSTAYCQIQKPAYLDYGFLSSNALVATNNYNPRLGSNSWAVSGKKTRSGYPILCSDPHLDLTFPSIWLEMQMSSAEVNVYGVTIPGTPAVIIGFNKNIAWGVTNGADDVRDWYKLEISEDYSKYKLDSQWVDLGFTVEKINRKSMLPFMDTIYHTAFGPVVSDVRFPKMLPALVNYASKWSLYDPSNELLAFIKLNRAYDFKTYQDAIRHYASPVQNFTFACRDGNIAVNHQGTIAVRQKGQGRFVMDGRSSINLGEKNIPFDSLPHMLNPDCNYVISANQHPAYPGYPYYNNGYYSENRANRIKDILDNGAVFDIERMKAMQLDNINSFAVAALPVLLKQFEKSNLRGEEKRLMDNLSTWNGGYFSDSKNAVLFELWWKSIREVSWDEFKRYPFYAKLPDDYILLRMIQKQPLDDYFDVESTTARELAGDVVRRAFGIACRIFKTAASFGIDQWGCYNNVSIMHLTRIDAFSKLHLASSGHPEAINAMSPGWGPTWRMIVELGNERPNAVGVYAGGQTGSIGSPYYDNFISNWNQGAYYTLNFYLSGVEAKTASTTYWLIQ